MSVLMEHKLCLVLGITKMFNRIYNADNPHQQKDKYKRVLCVCSAGLLRSPTAAFVLSQEPFNYNTRAAGIDNGHALIRLDDVLLSWADEIVVMDKQQERDVKHLISKNHIDDVPVIVLNIRDSYPYRDEELQRLIKENYIKATGM